jgi:hypothetical protein
MAGCCFQPPLSGRSGIPGSMARADGPRRVRLRARRGSARRTPTPGPRQSHDPRCRDVRRLSSLISASTLARSDITKLATHPGDSASRVLDDSRTSPEAGDAGPPGPTTSSLAVRGSGRGRGYFVKSSLSPKPALPAASWPTFVKVTYLVPGDTPDGPAQPRTAAPRPHAHRHPRRRITAPISAADVLSRLHRMCCAYGHRTLVALRK